MDYRGEKGEVRVLGFDPDMIFRIPALLIALTIHEYSHARMAVWLGDPTPRFMGRLTLNPLAHLDPIGLIMLWLFRFGWAKPVPIDARYFKNIRKDTILVSLAGPGSNILIAFVTMLLLGILSKMHMITYEVAQILTLTYNYNLIFAVFNLLPLPPLDGSKVLMSVLPSRQAYAFSRLEQYGTFILMGLVYVGIIGAVLYPIEAVLSFIIKQIVMLII